MADIAKCSNKECPKKDTCFRFLAEADKWQSYIGEPKKYYQEKNFEMYWGCKKGELEKLNRVHA